MENNFDPVTGQPLYRFDPETGAPLTPPNPGYKFDPETGEPINPVPAVEPAYKFNPETGEPINPAPAEPAYRFDPETGAPLVQEAPAMPQQPYSYGYDPKMTAGYGQQQAYDPNMGAYPQQPAYDPNGYGYYGQPQPTAKPAQGFAVTSMILGIASVVPFLWFIWFLPLVTGILGIIFGAMAKNKGSTSGMATAGIVCGIIGVSLILLLFLIGASCVGSMMSLM